MRIELQIPDHLLTLGELEQAQGAIFNASASYVDWEALNNGQPDAISPTGRVLLSIAQALGKATP